MTVSCPHCGHINGCIAACAKCGHALANGVSHPAAVVKPLPPPEAQSFVTEKMTPEAEALLGPLDLEAFRADVREIEETGGCRLEDFIGEIEEIVKRRD